MDDAWKESTGQIDDLDISGALDPAPPNFLFFLFFFSLSLTWEAVKLVLVVNRGPKRLRDTGPALITMPLQRSQPWSSHKETSAHMGARPTPKNLSLYLFIYLSLSTDQSSSV